MNRADLILWIANRIAEEGDQEDCCESCDSYTDGYIDAMNMVADHIRKGVDDDA